MTAEPCGAACHGAMFGDSTDIPCILPEGHANGHLWHDGNRDEWCTVIWSRDTNEELP